MILQDPGEFNHVLNTVISTYHSESIICLIKMNILLNYRPGNISPFNMI